MADLQDLLIRIDATTEQLRRELKTAEKAVDGTAKRIDRDLQKVDSRFVSLAKTAAKMGAAMAAAAVAAGGVKLIAVARETDILDAQLKTATGSAEGAAAAFSMLEGIAAETPYALGQVVTAFVRLKNLGLDPSREAIISYGNTAAAMGKSLDQMIEAVADATTGEFERLKEFGIRARKQGDQVSLTFRGITETIGNSAAEIEGYLRRLGDIEFAGAMTDRANSLDGALSNLGDSWDALFRTVARGPIGAAIEAQVRQGSMALQRLADMVARLQGTASPEQTIRGDLDKLFLQRQELERRMTMRRRGGPPSALVEELERVKDLIQENLGKLKALKESAGVEAASTAPAPVAAPSRSADITEISTHPKWQRIEKSAAVALKTPVDIVLEEIEVKTAELSEFAVAAAANIQTAFADFLFDPFSEGLDGMLDGFLRVIHRMVAEVAAQKILAGMFGGLASSGNPYLAGIGAAFGGFRANGGPLSPGKDYIVGERGPERFHSPIGGRISPIGSTQITIVDKRGSGAPPVEMSRSMSGGMEQIRVLIRGEVNGMFADGSIDRQFAASSMPIRRTGRR